MTRMILATLLCIVPMLPSSPALSQNSPANAVPTAASGSLADPSPSAPDMSAHAASPAASGPSTIALNIVVTPKKGAPVSGLQQQDFKLLDNKVPVPITGFRAVQGTGAPVEVVLVVDAVNAPYTSVAYTREQLDKFLRSNDGQLPFPTSIALFMDSGVQVQGGFSRNGNAEADALDHAVVSLRSLTRSAGFWGAAERFDRSLHALRELSAREAARPGRKLIVWVSPGWPLLSGPRIQLDSKEANGMFADIVGLSAQLRQANITLYDVNPIGAAESPQAALYYEQFLKGVSKLDQVQGADLSLQVLSTQSGGLVLTSSNDLVGELQKCFADGAAFYEVTFAPAPPEGRVAFHSLDVQVAGPGLTARTRQGYYVQP